MKHLFLFIHSRRSDVIHNTVKYNWLKYNKVRNHDVRCNMNIYLVSLLPNTLHYKAVLYSISDGIQWLCTGLWVGLFLLAFPPQDETSSCSTRCFQSASLPEQDKRRAVAEGWWQTFLNSGKSREME